MEAIYTGRSHRRGLCRAAVLVHRDGDNVFPSWAEIRIRVLAGAMSSDFERVPADAS